MTRKRTKTDYFKDLTWEDLEHWAGSTIVSRGKSYQCNGYVRDLANTPDGGLLAWVEGTSNYATWVDFENSALASTCSCPYWDTCKHAVAVVLEYLDCLKNDRKVPQVTGDDKRILLLEQLLEGEGWFEEEEYDLENEVHLEPRESGKPLSNSLQTFLKQQNKAQLIAIIEDLAGRYPLVRGTLQDLSDLSRGDVKEMVRALRQEILEVSSEPGWANYWRGERFIPDYSRVKNRLEALLAGGHADEIVTLGEELLDAGRRQVEMSNDEGETAMEISSCLDVVFRALDQCSLPPVEKMLWAVEAELQDSYDLRQGAEFLWNQKHEVEDWNILADSLMERLTHFRPTKGEDSFLRDYQRERLSDLAILALKNAERHDDIISLCEREAEKTGSYVRLVDFLLEAKRWEEAKQWIHKGIRATQKRWPGIARRLRTSLRRMREKEGDWLQVAAFRAEDFFSNPTLDTFEKLRKAAEHAEVWQGVKIAAMDYLETGKIPVGDSSWPLPKTETEEATKSEQRQFPLCETLVDIAVSEKQLDEVIRWYDQRKSQKSVWRWTAFKEDEVAGALVDHYPERALAIWKRLAEKEIAQTKPKAYVVAAGYLRKVQRTLKNLGKEKEWQSYLAELRRTNARKTRLLEILDTLSGRRIIG
jgi:uncharacterized Zn finger protein